MSSERAAEVMKRMVSMFSTGDLSDLQETVHSDYLDHQGLHGERRRLPGLPERIRGLARRNAALALDATCR